VQFEFYVLNYNRSKNKVTNYNIFNNIRVQECTEKAIKKYLRSSKKFTYKPYGKDEEVVYGFDALVEEIDGIIHWQEWSRREYEISVGDAFEDDCNKLEKIDCYYQAHANIKTIVREVIYQYKQQLKQEKNK
jgi:hypothetical protein